MYTFFPAGVQAQGVSAGVIAGGVAGGVAATTVLVLCCVAFVVVYLHKRKQPTLNVDETRYDLIGLVSSLSLATLEYNIATT